MKVRWWLMRLSRRRRQRCPECGEQLYQMGNEQMCGSCPWPHYYKGKVRV